MALDLYLLRHGESEGNRKGHVIHGQSPHLKLTPRGLQQVIALGQRLKKEKVIFDEIYSSPAVRARETARGVAKIIGFETSAIEYAEELLELSQGDWEGEEKENVYTPEVIEAIRTRPADFSAPNGESYAMGGKRMDDWVEARLLGRQSDLRIAVFGHADLFRAWIGRILKSDPRITFYGSSINNCSISQLRMNNTQEYNGWKIVRLNDRQHITYCGFTPSLGDD